MQSAAPSQLHFSPRPFAAFPVEVKLTTADGVPRECVVNLDLINTIPESTLTQQISTLSTSKLADVAKAIQFALDL